jgi:hypothetical protein
MLLTAENIILTLKIAVITVSILLTASLTAAALGRYRLHGRINIVFFVLTLTAVLGLEVIARFLAPDLFREYFDRRQSWTNLYVHLSFSLPAALLLPFMLLSGLRRWRVAHLAVGYVFLAFWIGTVITGVFFL